MNDAQFNMFRFDLEILLKEYNVKLVCSDPYDTIEIYDLLEGEDPIENVNEFYSDYVRTKKTETEQI